MASESIARAVLEMVADTTGYLSSMAGASKATKDFGAAANASGPTTFTSQVGQAWDKVKGYAGLAGLGLGAAALAGFANKAIDTAGELSDLSAKTGMGTSALQEFKYAGEKMNVSLDTITGAVGKMQARLAGGDASLLGGLKALGVSVDDFRAMKPEDQFRLIAEKAATIEDPVAKAKLATDIFGKSGLELIPALSSEFLGLTEQANSLGIVMDEDTVSSMDTLGDTMSSLGDVGMALIGKVLTPFVPLLSGVAQVALKLASVVGNQLKFELELVGRLLKWLANAALDTFRVTLNGLLSLSDAVPGLNKLTGSSDALRGALGLVDKAQAGLNATHTETKKQQAAVNTQFDEGAKAAKKEKDAVQDLADAFSGKKLAAEVAQTAAAFARATKEKQLDAYQTAELVKKIDGYLQQGAKLPPALANWYFAHANLNAEIATTVGGFQKLIATTPNVVDAVNKVLPPLAKIVQTDLGSILNFGKITPEQMHVDTPSEHFKKSFHKNFSGFMQNDFPNTMLDAITGGGNVFQAAGSSLGGFLTSEKGFGKKLSAGLTKVFPKGLADAISNMLPGLGTLMGPLLSGIANAVGKALSGNETKKAREDFAKSMGLTLDGLYSKLQTMGAEGQRLANQALNVIGKHDEAANKAWMAEVSKFFDDQKARTEALAQAAKEAYEAAQNGIGDALNKVITGTISSQDEFDRLSRIGLNTFNALVKSGVEPVEAMRRIGSSVDVLIASLDASGLKGNAAFEQLKRWRGLTEENAPLLDQVGSLNSLMEMTTTLGGMNAEVFADMQAQGLDAYGKLLKAGFTEAEARAQLKPLLEQEIRLNKEKGYAIDEATQRIIAQGIANGDLAVESESLTDVMKEGISALIVAMVGPDGLPPAWRKVSTAAKDAATSMSTDFARPAVEAVQGVASSIGDFARELGRGFEVPFTFTSGGDLAGLPAFAMAEGGFGRVTGPTVFLAGEAGAEDFAFSGGGRTFGETGFGGRSLDVQALADRLDRLNQHMLSAIPAMVEAAARHGAQTAGRRR